MTNKKKMPLFNENTLLLRAEVEHELRARAYKDDAFRQALQENPRAVLEREYPHWFPDGKIPEALSIRIIEEEQQTLNLVLLPQQSVPASFTLSEADLANIQGGSIIGAVENRVKQGETHTGGWLCGTTDVTCSQTACTHVTCYTSSACDNDKGR